MRHFYPFLSFLFSFIFFLRCAFLCPFCAHLDGRDCPSESLFHANKDVDRRLDEFDVTALAGVFEAHYVFLGRFRTSSSWAYFQQLQYGVSWYSPLLNKELRSIGHYVCKPACKRNPWRLEELVICDAGGGKLITLGVTRIWLPGFVHCCSNFRKYVALICWCKISLKYHYKYSI